MGIFENTGSAEVINFSATFAPFANFNTNGLKKRWCPGSRTFIIEDQDIRKESPLEFYKDVSVLIWAGKTGQLHVKEWN